MTQSRPNYQNGSGEQPPKDTGRAGVTLLSSNQAHDSAGVCMSASIIHVRMVELRTV